MSENFLTAGIISPRPDVLLKLVQAYSINGNLIEARQVCQQIIDWPCHEADPYRDEVQIELDLVNAMLSTP